MGNKKVIENEILTKILNHREDSGEIQVDLDDMQIPDEYVKFIMESIYKFKPNVTQIILSNNLIKDEGANIINDYLNKFPTLNLVSMGNNHVGKDGYKVLKSTDRVRIILFNNNLTYDDESSNHSFQ